MKFLSYWPGVLLFAASSLLFGADLTLDSASSAVTLEIRSTFHNFEGKAAGETGSLQLTPSPLAATGALEFPVCKVTTDSIQRDARMDEWLDIDHYPTIIYHLQSIRLLEGNAEKATQENPARFETTGTLTLHGKTQPMKVAVQGWRDGKHLVICGSATIHTSDYQLPKITTLFLTVNEDVKVHFEFRYILPDNYRTP